jgi:hypothetical protein
VGFGTRATVAGFGAAGAVVVDAGAGGGAVAGVEADGAADEDGLTFAGFAEVASVFGEAPASGALVAFFAVAVVDVGSGDAGCTAAGCATAGALFGTATAFGIGSDAFVELVVALDGVGAALVQDSGDPDLPAAACAGAVGEVVVQVCAGATTGVAGTLLAVEAGAVATACGSAIATANNNESSSGVIVNAFHRVYRSQAMQAMRATWAKQRASSYRTSSL